MTLLDVADLRVAYAGRVAVAGATLRVDGPQLVAVIGPNGSGKSSLLKAMLSLVASTGRVAWSGDAAIVRQPARLARVAAYLPQSPTAVAGQTVAQAILAGRFAHRGAFDFFDSPGDVAIARAVAADLALTEWLDRPLDELSGGQRQRVFLARSLAQRTPALVLDEPATYLDLRHQVELHATLARLVREEGKAILMASHDLNLAAAHADRMLVMSEGRIVADGPPGEVLTDDLLAAVYGIRMRRVDAHGRLHFVVIGTA